MNFFLRILNNLLNEHSLNFK